MSTTTASGVYPGICDRCGKGFRARTGKRFCSDECRSKSNNEKVAKERGSSVREPRGCDHCGEKFLPRSTQNRFCSNRCNVAHSNTDRPPIIGTGLRGASSELAVCIDLLARGWYVFRAVAPHGPFDIVATKGSRVLRVEATTGIVTGDGRIYYDYHKNHADKFDVVAVVVGANGAVMYFSPSGVPHDLD